MAKEKKLYSVYRRDVMTYNGNGVDSATTTCVGTTYAVSTEQAVNNVKHRLGIKPGDLYADGMHEYERITTFYAKEINY